jgi:hypothetical protein
MNPTIADFSTQPPLQKRKGVQHTQPKRKKEKRKVLYGLG